MSVSPRVNQIVETVPKLLDIFFDVVIIYGGTIETLEQILPVALQRIDQLFSFEKYQLNVQKIIENKVLALFHKAPYLVVTFKDLIISVIGSSSIKSRAELLLNLCWVVGEYASPKVDKKCTTAVSKLFFCFLLISKLNFFLGPDFERLSRGPRASRL